MGFGVKWRLWINGCLASSRASILVNGSPTDEFPIRKGVRQGDPLSPFLFIIAMEGLNIAMREACDKGLFGGIKIPNSNISISHLFYADDAIFLGNWDKNYILTLSRILKCFEVVSGLKVNFHKSRVFGINCVESELHRWSRLLGCMVDVFPFTYLGVPVGANMNLKKHWKPVVEKFHSKLSSWKAKTLSMGGRLTLVKAVLGSIPTYYLSLFKALAGILENLEAIRRRFFWGGGEDKKKIHWVAWDKVIADKKDGGLGVGSLKAQNVALLSKWWWRLKNGDQALWADIVRGIHNISNTPLLVLSNQPHSGVWKNASKAILDLSKNHIDPNSIITVERSSTRAEERLVCPLAADGRFTVKITRRFLDSFFAPGDGLFFRWIRLVPLKVLCFAWKAVRGRLPVADNLLARGINVQNCLCKLCGLETESTNHLLVKCSFAKGIRFWIFRWCGLPHTDFDNVNSLLDFAAQWGNCPKKKKILVAICYTLLWCIWKARNSKIFNNLQQSAAVIADDVISLSFFWIINRCNRSWGFKPSWANWLCSPFDSL